MPSNTDQHLGEAYGLTVVGDIALPDLAPAPNGADGAAADIAIRRGELDPWAADDLHALNEFIHVQDGRLSLDIPGKLLMRIEDGRSITYRRYPDVPDDDIRLFLLGSGLGAIMMQRGSLVLHANAIAMPNGRAVICLGDSGAGKSTTATALMQRGFRILSDDVCAIDRDGTIPRGVPRVKLWDDAARGLGVQTAQLERFKGSHDKWNLPLTESDPAGEQRPGLFILLETGDGDMLDTAPVAGREAFAALRNNLYRAPYCRALGIEADCIARLAYLASATPMYRVTWPARGFTVEPLVDRILDLHASCAAPD